MSITYAHFLLLNMDPNNVTNYHQIKEQYCLVSASEFGALFGVSPYLSKKALWRKLKGLEPPKNKFVTEAVHLGRVNEPIARDLFWKVYKEHYPNRQLEIPDHGVGTGFLWYDPRFAASPDSLFSYSIWHLDLFKTELAQRKKQGLEIKCPQKALPEKLDWTHCHFLLQCVLNMEVFDVDYWHLFFYREGKYAWFGIHRNKAFFESFLKPKLDELLAMEKEPPKMKKGKKGEMNEKQAVAEAIMNQYNIETLEV